MSARVAYGSELRDGKTLQRIDEAVVRAEVEAADVEFVREASTWRNEDDARDGSASPGAAGDKRGTSDRFAHVYRRPAE